MEVEGADLRGRVAHADPEEAREEDEVEEAGEGLGRVGVEDPRNRLRLQLVELRAGAGAIVRRRRTRHDFLKELKDERQEGLVGGQRTRIGSPDGLLCIRITFKPRGTH